MLNYGLVYASKIEDLTPNVLPYRKGYVPRINDTVPYVVRAEHAVTFDGTTKKTLWETERFFGTRKEADTWASTKSLEDGVKRVADTDNNWKTKDPSYQQDVNEAVFTGLYEDYRGNKIPYGPSGEDSPRVGAFDAMDRYLSNLSWSYPLNEWRQSVLARYFNSVNKYLEVPNDINSNFSSTASITETQKNAIIHVRDYLKDQLSISTEGERIFARTARQMADSMKDSWFWNGVRKYLPKGDKLTEAARMKFLYGADNYEGYGLLRNAAFRVYLGFMNISQLVVQASNMAVVASLHPLNAPSVMRRMLSMRMMANLTPESRGYEKAARIAAKAALMKYEDFEPMVRALYRSGWTYTVRSSADAAMALRGIAPGGDVKHLG